jgi:hypothetical protein
MNLAAAVPNHSGSWNVDAYGRLTREFLIITRPQDKEAGSQIVPVHRLVYIEFGDMGIKSVDERHPQAP